MPAARGRLVLPPRPWPWPTAGAGEMSLRGFCLPSGWVFRNISSNIGCQGMKSDPSLYLHSLPGDQMRRWEAAKFLTFAQIPLLKDPWPFDCQKARGE